MEVGQCLLPTYSHHLGPIHSWWPWLQPITVKGLVSSLQISKLQCHFPSAYIINMTIRTKNKKQSKNNTLFQRSFRSSFLVWRSLSLHAYCFLIATPTQGVASFLFCILDHFSQSYSAELDPWQDPGVCLMRKSGPFPWKTWQDQGCISCSTTSSSTASFILRTDDYQEND